MYFNSTPKSLNDSIATCCIISPGIPFALSVPRVRIILQKSMNPGSRLLS